MVAGLTNIAAREMFVRLPLAPIMVSIFSGTVLRYFVKYLREKRLHRQARGLTFAI
jgi:hypothetical protein